ncbi:hypothetical protein MIND_01046500 [Mycena indigotica]|uniref:Uncharacterized protein n=1 Tax=Mycena indigotica TaxID=2126181 RepID=A0A8H6VV68_9AGAR|nr:uncharacterized protein MIND_01046500 [Mycena indigotica]KAF7295082.1 hypothetical protein MIND_01046500 [Mycena indigotica]
MLPLTYLFVLACASASAQAAIPRGSATHVQIEKRFSNARFTFFDTGLGACGSTNVGSDFIVALNSEVGDVHVSRQKLKSSQKQYGNGEHCYKMIEITYKGKTKQAQIVDMCPGCGFGALDFSTGLFDYFASEDLGVIYGSWKFLDGTVTTTTQKTTTRPLPTRTTSHIQLPISSTTPKPMVSPVAPAVLDDVRLALSALLGVVSIGA